MPGEPVPADPGWDDDPAWSRPDPVPAAEREAWLDHLAAQDEPLDLEEEHPGPEDELTAEELAEIRGDAGAAGRAAAFGAGAALDVMPGCPELALFADAAAGTDDGYAGVSDDELTGLLRAWDRVEAHAAARKLAAAAARNPKTTWCVTVTDQDGHAIGHGCARPEPKSHRKRAGPGPPGGTGTGTATAPGSPSPRQRPRTARRLRNLAAADPGRRPGPDRHPGPDHHRRLRPPVPGQGPRPRGKAPAPGPGPARHLHQPGLPQARQPVRLRAQHPLRSGRPVVLV